MREILTFCLVIAAAAITGCQKRGDAARDREHGAGAHSHGDGAEHAHEAKTAQITVWASGYEIFAEHTAAVEGQPARFVTHISEVNTGQPRREGMVKFVLSKDGEQFEHPQAAPERPGIYIPAITFPNAVEWKMSIVIPGLTNAVIALGSIAVFGTADEAAHAEFPEAPEGISFLKEQQWRIAMKSVPITRRTITQQAALPATIIPAPGNRAAVYSPVVGTVTKQEVSLGDLVKAGDVLAWIQPGISEFTGKVIEADAEAVRSKTQFEQAKTAYERVKRLHEQRAKSDRELQESEAQWRSAQATHDAALAVQAQYQRSGATLENGAVRVVVKSPISGTVEKVFYHSGERVQPDQALFSVMDLSTVYVEASMTPDRLSQITRESSAFLQLNQSTHSPELIRLEPVSIGSVLDPVTRTTSALYRMTNTVAVSAGAFGKVLVTTGISTNAIAVPASAVVEEDGIPVMFVQISGETFLKRDIVTGVQDQGWIEIKSGASEGERVVADGAYALLLSTKSGTIPAHGHAH
jgi:membrane fusion protein, heavy metal efflux system